MKKHLFLIGLLLVVLSGCNSDEKPNPDDTTAPNASATNGIKIEKPNLVFIIPASWREIAANEFPEALLKRDPVAVFRRREADNGIFPNLVITSQSVSQTITALEFSRQTRENNSATLLDYEELRANEKEIAGQTTTILEFVARSAADERLLRFWQTVFVKQGTAYVLTAVASPQANEIITGEIEYIFNNIGIK